MQELCLFGLPASEVKNVKGRWKGGMKNGAAFSIIYCWILECNVSVCFADSGVEPMSCCMCKQADLSRILFWRSSDALWIGLSPVAMESLSVCVSVWS